MDTLYFILSLLPVFDVKTIYYKEHNFAIKQSNWSNTNKKQNYPTKNYVFD